MLDATFQNGASPDATYFGTFDTEIRASAPGTPLGSATSINVDGADRGGAVQGLIRFEDLFGDAAGQLPLDADVTAATLELNVSNPGNAMSIHRMLQAWDENVTWNTFGGDGIQANGTEALAVADATTGGVSTGTLSIDVTASLQAWQVDPSTNHGWVLLPGGTNGVDFNTSESATIANRPKLIIQFDTSDPGDPGDPGDPPAVPGIGSFQEDVDGYTGTLDTEIRASNPSTPLGSATAINVDGADGGGAVQGLVRFENLFGDAAGQVPLDAGVTVATLELNVFNPGNALSIHRMLQAWDESSTWSAFGGNGVQADGVEALAVADATTGSVSTGILSIDVTASLQAWQADPSTNHGWVLLPGGTNGVDFYTSESATIASRPKLIVEFNAGGTSDPGDPGDPGPIAPQYAVNHTPYLQLGDAPLIGYAGSQTDQVEVLWQTVAAGSGTEDSFVAEYRRTGDTSWNALPAPTTLDTGVETRINHSVEIVGLDFAADYEYRVDHLRGGQIIETWQNSFHTRLEAGNPTPFTFVAYGDSADPSDIGAFRGVQARINQIDPALSILLGDNVYTTGTHAELDTRFDPSINPEAAQWQAGHIDYLGFGNHDIASNSGKPSEDNFSVPIPVTGATAPAAPVAEPAEHNYAFDYGNVHFVTFDSNSLADATRLDAQLDYVEADLAASDAPWKIVYAHHPIGAVPDKPQGAGDNYYQQVVSRLRAAGADLLMVGHSHTYSWTYPLLGEINGQATYVLDTDKDYAQGAGLIQLVSGVGGRALRSGSYDIPAVAAGFTASTSPASEFGFAQIDVTPDRLTVSYIAADDGATIDSFTITADAGDPPVPPEIVSFQQDVDAYTGTLDTEIRASNPGTPLGSATAINVDGADGGGEVHGLIRFEDLFGDAAGQVPLDADVTGATLELNVVNPGNAMSVYRMLQAWDESSTWNTFGGNGVQANDTEAATVADATTGSVSTGTLSIDVTASVQSWQADPSTNHGWVLLPGGTNGVDFSTSESATIANRPRLTVQFDTVDPGDPAPDTTPPSARLATPEDNGPADLDPTANSVLIGSAQVSLEIQLSDDAAGIDDSSVAAGDVTITLEGNELTDYTFSYDDASDRITLEATAAFGAGTYQIRIDSIGDKSDNVLATTVIDLTIDPAQADSFTIVVLPDTQKYSESYPATYTAQTQWIVDHIETDNLAFVTHVGDVVENPGVAAEWTVADAAMNLLDGDLQANPNGLIPYSVAPGNHDFDSTASGQPHSTAVGFVENFGSDRYEGRSWYGTSGVDGASDNDLNHHQFFTAGGILFHHIALEWEPRGEAEIDSAVRWAKDRIAERPDVPVIVSTHAYLSASGYITSATTSDGLSGQELFDEFVRTTPQIFMVLSGHVSAEAHRISQNDAGQEVIEILADYQSRSNGGDGWLRLMEFFPEQDRIDVTTYSPTLDRFETDANSQFSLSIDFDTRFNFASPQPPAGMLQAIDQALAEGWGTPPTQEEDSSNTALSEELVQQLALGQFSATP